MPVVELLVKFWDISATDWPMVSWVGITAAGIPPLLKLFEREEDEAIDVLLLWRLAPIAVLAATVMAGNVLVEARLLVLWLLFM